MFARQEASGQPATMFCEEHDLCISHFYKVRRRLRREHGGSFVPVRVAAGSPRLGSGVAIELADVTIRCDAGTSVGWLSELVAVLRG